jgi:calnexin
MAPKAVFLLALVACSGLANAVRLEFAGGLDGWTHSDDSKYAGKFVVEAPEGLPTKALKVGGAPIY